MAVPFAGECRCRAACCRCTAEPALVVHCYCRDCQYASGGAGSTVLVVTEDSVTVEGRVTTFTVAADSGTSVSRLFCPTCGSPLFARNAAAPTLFVIKAGTLDDPSWLRPVAHIWTDNAPPWARNADDLPQFPKNFGET